MAPDPGEIFPAVTRRAIGKVTLERRRYLSLEGDDKRPGGRLGGVPARVGIAASTRVGGSFTRRRRPRLMRVWFSRERALRGDPHQNQFRQG